MQAQIQIKYPLQELEQANLIFEFKIYFPDTEKRLEYAEKLCKQNNIQLISIEKTENKTDFDIALLKVEIQPKKGKPFYHFCLAYKFQNRIYFIDTLYNKQCILKIEKYFGKQNIIIKNTERIQYGDFGCLEFSIDLANKIRNYKKDDFDNIINTHIEKFKESRENPNKFTTFAIKSIRNNLSNKKKSQI